MTATEELRRLLDERGVKHVDAEDGHTQHTWWSDGDHEIAASNNGKRLAVYGLDPEQAVEATLGRRECRLVRHGNLTDWPEMVCWSCSVCDFGWHHDVNDKQFRYCPNCGRRVVDE